MGLTDENDEGFKDALKAFQRITTIQFDDTDIGPGSTTERILNNELKAQDTGTLYIWRTVGDEKVRGEHARRNGQVFSWDNPPNGEIPGEDYNCRCWAEAVNPRRHVWLDWLRERQAARMAQTNTLQSLAPPKGLKDKLIDELPEEKPDVLTYVWTAAAILVILRLGGKVALPIILRVLKNSKLAKNSKQVKTSSKIFQKPKNMPDDWVEVPHKGGRKFIRPCKSGDKLWITKGKPDATYEGQQYDYVRWQKDGKALDIDGKIIDAFSKESHIPLKDFKFRPELFK